MIKRVVNWVAPGLMVVAGAAVLAASSGAVNAAPATLQLAQAGSIVTVQSPLISDYWMSATRQSGGVIVFDGYAPDDATRKRLGETADADTNFLKLGRGAPENYQAAADFGLAVLARLSEGRFSLDGANISLTGMARSSQDYGGLTDLLSAGLPPGFLLARNEIQAPPVTPYLLTATKKADGSVALTGMLPNAAAKASLAVAEGNPSVIAVTYASGEPDDLIVSATTALGLLKWLDTGAAVFDGTGWSLSGTAATAADKAAIESAFTTRRLAASGWTLKVTAPAAAEPVIIATEPADAEPAAAEPTAETAAAEPTAAEPTPEPAAVEPTTAEPAAETVPVAPAVTPEPIPATPPAAAPTTPKPPLLATCQASVDEFSARNAILFQSGAALLAPESAAALDELAGYLALCPEADVDVEGHTDADGDDQLNLALSVARAEAVIDALIARNTAPGRLYAIGYGESQPIADNDTSAGKRLNRRIVIKVLEHHLD